jgi:uncharacterized protein YjbI with pentapeptide repeats
MKIINNQTDFLNWLYECDSDENSNTYCLEKSSYFVEGSELLEISNVTIDEEDVYNKYFTSSKFRNCTFKSVNFKHSTFHISEFYDCTFINCDLYKVDFIEVLFENTIFFYCTIVGIDLSDTETNRLKFSNCNELLDLKIRGSLERNIEFFSCNINFLDIEPIKEKYSDSFIFEDCIVKESSFDRINFNNSSFDDCSLSLNQFSACIFDDDTFINENSTPGNEFNLIDIRTILNSPILNIDLLTSLFGVQNPFIKEYLVELTSELNLQSIFISYSFKDSAFAKGINSILKEKGVLTFLWEDNSEGGKRLNNIMESNINSKDRILFIASENSIKSEACQFELSQGQIKQDITWKEVLFPIHIDNFLFEVTKEQIRPQEKRDEYWKNINELKKINSLNFSPYKKEENRKGEEFENLIFRLLKGLKK